MLKIRNIFLCDIKDCMGLEKRDDKDGMKKSNKLFMTIGVLGCLSVAVVSICVIMYMQTTKAKEIGPGELEQTIEACQDILDNDPQNADALTKYICGLQSYGVAGGKNLSSQATNAYRELANYVYAYSTKTNPKDNPIESACKEFEEEFKNSGAYGIPNSLGTNGKVTVKGTISWEKYGNVFINEEMESPVIGDNDGDDGNGTSDNENDDTLEIEIEVECWGFPQNTAPEWIKVVEVIWTEGEVCFVFELDWHQAVANEVYYRWVEKRLAKGIPAEQLTWDIYVKLEWLPEEYPEWFELPTLPNKETEPVQTETEIVPIETETQQEENNYADYAIGVDGNTKCFQDLTGNVVSINGMTPVYLFTELQQTPVGEQISLQLLDENYNLIAVNTGFDCEHTKYRYAYLTSVDISDSYVLFFVSGSDEEVNDNLLYNGYGDVETENGIEQYQRFD